MKIRCLLEFTSSLFLICCCVFIPSFPDDYQPGLAASNKSLFLGSVLLGVIVFRSIDISISNWTFRRIELKQMDVLIFVFSGYLLINGYALHNNASITFRLLEFCCLLLVYTYLRNTKLNLAVFAFAAVIIGGLIQTIHGNLQLHGYFPSNHSGFPLTGSFFNPGPYSGYLAAVFPAALGLHLFVGKFLSDKYNIWQKILKYFYLGTCGGILLVLPATQSRAAWLGVLASTLFLLYHRYHWRNYLMGFIDRPVKRYIVAFFSAIVLIGLLGSMYLFKKGSADGRLLIWKVSLEMIKEQPWVGLGFDRFKAGYMEAQAAYFQAKPQDPSAYLADDVIYAFNEGLQFLVEQGIIGLLLVSLMILLLFRTGKNKPSAYLRISQAGIISIMVFGMFSYPSHILPIKICGVLYLAIAAGESRVIFSRRIKRPNLFMVWGLSLSTLVMVTFAGTKLYGLYRASKDWKEALGLYNGGAYGEAIEKYKEALPYFGREGEFLTNYGKALSVKGLHKEAVITLEQAKNYVGNTIIQTALGDSYKALGLYGEAELAYRLAVDMLPDRFYGRYLLVKLYEETGEQEKLIPIARYLTEKEPKVPSRAVEEIKREMKKILDKSGE